MSKQENPVKVARHMYCRYQASSTNGFVQYAHCNIGFSVMRNPQSRGCMLAGRIVNKTSRSTCRVTRVDADLTPSSVVREAGRAVERSQAHKFVEFPAVREDKTRDVTFCIVSYDKTSG